METVLSTTAPSLPAACADCLETTLLAEAGAIPIQLAMQHFRALDGRLRINIGTTSMIWNPKTQIQILLDHVALEAMIISGVAMAGAGLPSAALGIAAGLVAGAAIFELVQLGRALIEGHEVEGVRYVFAPGAAILSWEVWTSTKLSLPVLTRTIGAFGERMCYCRCTPVQPAPSMFEIPPGYTVVNSTPQPPAPPVPVTSR